MKGRKNIRLLLFIRTLEFVCWIYYYRSSYRLRVTGPLYLDLLYDWGQDQRKKCAFTAYIAHIFN